MMTPGTRLGPYEILVAIGAGGMGEVYRARDTRLDRIVAIKVLPREVAADPERRQRFEIEARSIAALNHPNICTLHDVGHQNGIDFLVLEHLEGRTLAERIATGPIPIDEALQIGVAIADALDKAHRAGIVHRDLKPGNIMLTKNGVKLLDFGLAMLRASGQLSGLSALATRAAITVEGTILGTAQYMAPEQLEGRQADARSDIFSFGAVLHEMLTGRKAFEGNSGMSLVSAILRDTPPPVSTLISDAADRSPDETARLRLADRLIATSLAKDPDDRWQTARDLWRELKWIAESDVQIGRETLVSRSRTGGLRRPIALWAATLAAALVGLLAGGGIWTLKPRAAAREPSIIRAALNLPPGETLGSLVLPSFAWSPDGSALVYASVRAGSAPHLRLQVLNSPESTIIAGTDGAVAPFFSPDGQWIGFFAAGKLKKVLTRGGAPQVICSAAIGLGGSWGPNDTVYLAPFNTSGLWKVSASGGTPQEVTKLDRSLGETSHRWPQVLPDGNTLLFTVWTGPGWDEHQLQLLDLATGKRHAIVQGAASGHYVPTGHLVYTRADLMMAVPFDLAHLRVTGTPVALDERALDDDGAQHAESSAGTLASLPVSPRRSERQLLWVDSNGTVEVLPVPPWPYTDPAVSPDGRLVAVSVEGPVQTIWVYDVSRRTMTPLTSPAEGSSQAPTWTPDGTRVAYRGTRAGFRNVFWKAADGSGEEERLTLGDNLQSPGSWSPDGKNLVFVDVAPASGADLWVLSRDGLRASALVSTPVAQGEPAFSPDGRWLAYESDESGTTQIYVQPFPGPAGKVQISTEGGTEARWSRDGRRLFYRTRDNKRMSVAILPQPVLSAGPPTTLFEGR